MKQERKLTVIAKIHNDFPTKFGLPRQSGLADSLKSTIVFEQKFRNPDSLRGLEGFSHIWLLWDFSEVEGTDHSPTVRPPRLGGNTRMGVFATRSPYRPNPIGLSAVKLDSISYDKENGAVLHVSGADLMDGTPIYDIKPYLPITDCKPDAKGGFSDSVASYSLKVNFPKEYSTLFDKEKAEGLREILSQDPRPAYHEDGRTYGFFYANTEVKFSVENDTLTVESITRLSE